MQTQTIAPMQKRVDLIPANVLVGKASTRKKKLRVAAYCRVSTEQEEQQSSYAAQIAYYTDKISQNKDWELAGIFADEGITGTSTKKRDEFLKLMALCEKGKIDMVLTKSVSRFSRNTLDAITYIRKLKAKGIPIIFEKEGINTMQMASEMALCFLSGFAQAESESISRNVTWGKRQSFKNGNVPFQYKRLLGYEKGEDGQPKVVPEEAEMVKRIFRSYYAGASISKIKKSLEADGIPSPTGKEKWSPGVLQYMLRNERYIGDALLQKSYTTDTMPFRTVRNKGEKDRYYITGSHEAMISRTVFEQAQQLMKARNALCPHKGYGRQYVFSQKIRCGKCGTNFSRRVTNGKVYWMCRRHFRSKELCEVRQIREDAIIQAFNRMYNKLKQNSGYILTPALSQLTDLKSKITMSDGKIGSINKEIAELTKQSLVLNRLRTKGYMDSVIFMQKTNEINQQLDLLKRNRRRLMESDADDQIICDCRLLIGIMEQGAPFLADFDEMLFYSMVHHIVVTEQDKLRFHLLGGFTLTEPLPGEVFGR